MPTEKPRHVAIDIEAGVIELYGIKYALELFHILAFAPIGTVVKIVDRADGLVTLETVQIPQKTVAGAAEGSPELPGASQHTNTPIPDGT